MDSALRPREIQARVRAGESLEDVAEAAGVPIERIAVFAGPVLDERGYIARLAQDAPVRREGETTSTRALLEAVTQRLSAREVVRGDIDWDAWKLDGRRWHVQAEYVVDGQDQCATFAFDLDGRFSVATNEDGRWLIGDDEPDLDEPLRGPGRGNDPDAEPTLDLDDELALVRAVDVERDPYDFAETGDAYTPGDLAEIDGIYDIVPPSSDMDILYDMLSSFNEDSIQIYRGLTRPVIPGDGEDPADLDSVEPTATDDDDDPLKDWGPSTPTVEPSREQPDSAAVEPISTDDAAPSAPKDTSEVATSEPVRRPRPRTTPEPDQPTLDGKAPPRPRTSPPRRSRRRAAVPSWDEIMFGSSPPPPADPS